MSESTSDNEVRRHKSSEEFAFHHVINVKWGDKVGEPANAEIEVFRVIEKPEANDRERMFRAWPVSSPQQIRVPSGSYVVKLKLPSGTTEYPVNVNDHESVVTVEAAQS